MKRAATDLDRRIGDRIRQHRLKRKMTQQRLADLVDLSYQQLAKYERGMDRISASRLQHVAAALRLPVAAFFDPLDGDEGSVLQHVTLASLDVIDSLDSLDPQARRAVVAFVKTLSAYSATAGHLRKAGGL